MQTELWLSTDQQDHTDKTCPLYFQI